MAIETPGSTSNELDIESSGEYKIGRIRSDEECSSNISYSELGMYPCSWMYNIGRYPVHV